MYAQAKKQIELLEVNSKQNNTEKLELEIQQKDAIIEQQALEIDMYKRQLSYLQPIESNGSVSNSLTAGSTSKLSLDDAPNSVWKNRLEELSRKHMNDMENVNKTFYDKLLIHQKQYKVAQEKITLLEDDLRLERQRHLETVTAMRDMHSRKSSSELELKERIQQLLNEVSEKRSEVDDKDNIIQTLIAKLKIADEKCIEYIERQREMVSKEQVKEMENLFLDTVTKLSNRVKALESNTSENDSKSSMISESIGNRLPKQPENSAKRVSFSGPQVSSASSSKSGNTRIEPGGRIRPAASWLPQQDSRR